MVEYELDNLPPVDAAERARLAALRDEDINLHDMPEITDFSGFVRWKNRDVLKKRRRIELEVDADVLAWIGENYQSRINAILREVMKLTALSGRS